jgi:NADH-quinone oxidoreductase subunit G
MVVSMNAFKTNMDVADVLLPIAPFTETSGTFVNAEGLAQSFHAVVKPLGETRPAWKVLRVLCNLLEIPGVTFETSQEVLAATGVQAGLVAPEWLSNASASPMAFNALALDAPPSVAGIYQLDGIVRRAPALQHTADATQEVFL